ncbi:MAG: hypothetical protein ACP5K9_01795 [Candidatus Micrarchaeia archaeon]
MPESESELNDKLRRLEGEKRLVESSEKLIDKEERILKKEIKDEEKLEADRTAEKKIEKKILSNSIKNLTGADWLFIAAIIAIIVVTIYFRIPMLKYFGFYEPDGFYHFSVIRAAVNDGFIIPKYLVLSGWPAHTYTGEPHGLYWVTLAPYFFLRFFGVSYYTIMRLIPVLFGVFDVIGAYYLVRYLGKSRLLGLLAMLFVALSMGDAARTSTLIYRGDGFVTIFLIIALFFAIKIAKTNDKNAKLKYALLSGFFLSVCNFVWNGAPFATATYVVAFFFIAAYAFVIADRKMLRNSGYMLIAMLLWYLLVNLYKFLEFILEQTFTGKYFIMLLALMFIGYFLADYLLKNKERLLFVQTPRGRFVTATIFVAAALIAIDVAAPAFVYSIFVANGFITTGSNFAVTIEELQPPTPQFLFASFGASLFTTPMAIVVYLSSYILHPKYVMWFLMLIFFAPYAFMKIENRNGENHAVWRFGIDEALLVLIAYYATTAYLQMHAVRFNSLLAVPLAIFSAYTVYWLVLRFKRYKMIGYGVLAALCIYMFFLAVVYTSVLVQADNINPQFISALEWLKNNSSANAVVLTLWPDGSVVEGVANRTSVTDSVGSQNVTKADAFAAWLLNSSPDGQFLTSSINGKPNYLLVRYSWLLETSGIYTESGTKENASLFGYLPFSRMSEYVNASTQIITFSSPNGISERTILKVVNNTQAVSSYLIYSNGISPVTYVAFYNVVNGTFSIVRQNAYNKTNGELLVIAYSTIRNPNMAINITGGYVFNTGLELSNMLKFLYFCNNQQCLWNSSVAKMQLVYINTDTKIFRIIYNSSQ